MSPNAPQVNHPRIALDPATSVGQLAAANSARSRLFEELGIDYCCGGKQPLREACAAKGLAVEDVIIRLEATPQAADCSTDYGQMPLAQLVEHILGVHHAYLKRELPRLEQLADKVAKVHGECDPRLSELNVVLAGLHQELAGHLLKEEQILFSGICALADVPEACAAAGCSVEGPISVMEAEHVMAGEALRHMRELTDGFVPPWAACNTYRALLSGLVELEHDLHQLIHKENNILFPRALALWMGR